MDKNLGGRPTTEIDKDIFEGLCRILCTKNDICDVFNCDEKTLTRWCKDNYNEGFSDVYKKKAAPGKVSLRRLQFKSAEEGNVTMQIWLGKQFLEQKDKQEVEHSGSMEVVNLSETERKARIDELKRKLES
jgi:hypothetical protein